MQLRNIHVFPSKVSVTWDWNCRHCSSQNFILFLSFQMRCIIWLSDNSTGPNNLFIVQSLYVCGHSARSQLKWDFFSWRPLCRHCRCIFFRPSVKSKVHVAEPLGRNWVTILQMSWWLFIFNLHWGSLCGFICLMKQHIDQISSFPDVDKKVVFHEDMHYLKHPRKEPGTRSEKQLNN